MNLKLFKLNFQTQQHHVDGKSILEIRIPPRAAIPHRAQNEAGKWLVYIRKNDQNIVAPAILLKIWEQKHNPHGVFIRFSAEENLVLSLFKLHPNLSLNQISRQAKLPRWKSERLLVQLIVIGVVGMEINEGGTRFMLQDDSEDRLTYHYSR